MYACYNKNRSKEEYIGEKHDQIGGHSGTCEKAEVAYSERNVWQMEASSRYLNSTREDLEENQQDQTNDGLTNLENCSIYVDRNEICRMVNG
jgi:hypothetical protein